MDIDFKKDLDNLNAFFRLKKMKDYNEQEKFWASDFGDEYLERNKIEDLLPAKISLFSDIIKNLSPIKSLIEFGPNTGVNLIALKNLMPSANLNAVELNKKAVDALKNLKICNNIWQDSILKFNRQHIADLSFTSGVLIHLSPNHLSYAYETLYNSSNKYILICEYYNPSPVELSYRGHKQKLFKRDFAGELLSKYSDLALVNYGFRYYRDNNLPLDDITWFLMKKK